MVGKYAVFVEYPVLIMFILTVQIHGVVFVQNQSAGYSGGIWGRQCTVVRTCQVVQGRVCRTVNFLAGVQSVAAVMFQIITASQSHQQKKGCH